MTYTLSAKRNYRFFGATLVEIHCTDKKRNARFSQFFISSDKTLASEMNDTKIIEIG